MIPYFPQPEIRLGPLTFHMFGALVGLGVVFGLRLAYRRAVERGISLSDMRGAAWSALIFGFWASFACEVLFYKPWYLEREGWKALFNPSHGMSSYGGLIGAYLALVVYFRIKGIRWQRHADLLIEAFVLGWIFGRLGCTFAHDHQGAPTSFFLAFRYPDTPRHNLGFYEFLYTLFILYPVSRYIGTKLAAPPGLQGSAMALLYGPMRFGLDFLRSTDQSDSDSRYAGLTFAQYCCVAVTAYGVMTLRRSTAQFRAANAGCSST